MIKLVGFFWGGAICVLKSALPKKFDKIDPSFNFKESKKLIAI